MSYSCKIVEQSAQPTLTVRLTTAVQELPQQLGKTYAQIAQYLAEQSEQPAGAPFVAYYNMNMQNLDVEIGFPVARTFAGQGAIQSSALPVGKIAECLYTGPYSDCGPAYEALTQHVQANGYEATGVAYEFYLNDPIQTPPAELQTRIVFPLQSN